MLPKEQKDKLLKHCMECNSQNCVHIKEDGSVNVPPSEKLTSDGKPETLGINVSEKIKSGETVG